MGGLLEGACDSRALVAGPLAAALLTLLIPGAVANAADCDADGDSGFVCGIPSAEDLVQVGDTPWLIASGYAGPTALNLIDTRARRWRAAFPAEGSAVRHDRERFGMCPGEPQTEMLTTHGLFITGSVDGLATLYAVGHGGREAIEVFEVRHEGVAGAPAITWIGCVPTPDEQEANSVVALSDGSLLATIPLETGREFAEAMLQEKTGAVYRWSAADDSWTRLEETAQPYANGIEVSADESVFYVASSGLANVAAFSNSVPAKRLWTSDTLPIAPDNLHRADDGRLLTAGLLMDYPECNPYNAAGNFDLALFGSCARPYNVLSIDPAGGAFTVLVAGSADSAFSNATTGVIVNDRVWVGTFAGDRVAYQTLRK